MKATNVIISTGTYNTSDYRPKAFTYTKSAFKYAKAHGYPFSELCAHSWNFHGTKFNISISNQ